MPVSYVHFVHLLTGIFLIMAPLCLLPEYYFWAVPAVGLLTLFYGGIFTLSLMFLDP